MCGIVGYLASSPSSLTPDEVVLARMRDALTHRGPDSAGLWQDPSRGVGLAHRRLAIVDLTAAGAQPMESVCGRYVIVFNGEIYNHRLLREGLTGNWRGHSDTETLLALFSRYGVVESLPKLVGMFALAVWDRDTRALTLARDRFGEKPLYWGRLSNTIGNLWIFGSELRAFRAHPAWSPDLDPTAVDELLRSSCIGGTKTIWRGIHKLAPAHWLRITSNNEITEGCYWDLTQIAKNALNHPFSLTDSEATDQLEILLVDSLKGQMLADVPLGAFLSGGIDSSTIVALMSKLSRNPIKTFSIGFSEGTSEAADARAVAEHLGSDHTELIVTSADALRLVPQLPTLFDEPFADSSQIPTLLVAQLARRHVTVALSGDAGDELFAGYNRHVIAAKWWPLLRRLPPDLRRAMSSLICKIAPARWDTLLRSLQSLQSGASRYNDVGHKLHKFAEKVLPATDLSGLYAALRGSSTMGRSWVRGSQGLATALIQIDEALRDDPMAAMCLADQLGYLADDILVKVDRAAMAYSLETRVPFLDHRLAEWSWRLPATQKIRDGHGKWLLRQVLYRYVPRALVERPKQGFAAPIDTWLRGPLRHWADELLNPAALAREGILDADAIRSAWIDHQSGRRARGQELWNALMFQAWWQSAQTR